jgi:hypothetical protein
MVVATPRPLLCPLAAAALQELGAITSLTDLSVSGTNTWPVPFKAASLAVLSTLTRLASLSIIVDELDGRVPPESLNRLARLTSLKFVGSAGFSTAVTEFSAEHLAPCTALQKLSIVEGRLSMSAAQALGAWRHLSELYLSRSSRGPEESPAGLGYWHALPELPNLKSVRPPCCSCCCRGQHPLPCRLLSYFDKLGCRRACLRAPFPSPHRAAGLIGGSRFAAICERFLRDIFHALSYQMVPTQSAPGTTTSRLRGCQEAMHRKWPKEGSGLIGAPHSPKPA